MASNNEDDPHQGGRLEDWAESGTSIPNDAGLQRTIPSVPQPDEADADATTSESLATAAANPTDIPRTARDTGMTGAVVTGTGDPLPAAAVEGKNMAGGGNEPLAKGSSRYAKHARQPQSDVDKYASEGVGVEAAPGEEDVPQEELRSRREQ